MFGIVKMSKLTQQLADTATNKHNNYQKHMQTQPQPKRS